MDKALARNKDPETSHLAAESVHVGRLEMTIVAALKEGGPMSTYHIAEYIGADRDSVSPRMKKLESKGLVYKTGRTVTNKKNRQCIEWRATHE